MSLITTFPPVQTESKTISPQLQAIRSQKELTTDVARGAFIAIGIAAGLTGLFFALPVVVSFLPFLIFVVVIIVALLCQTSVPQNQGMDPGALFKISIYLGVELGKWIYTAKVALVAGLIFGGVAGIALLVAGGAGLAYLYYRHRERQIEQQPCIHEPLGTELTAVSSWKSVQNLTA